MFLIEVVSIDGIDLVLGVDYLDREDIRILPVGGLLLHPDRNIRIHLVFPNPRLDIQLTEQHRIYFNGGMGGGTWAVERDNEVDDLATYYDLHVGLGLAKSQGNGKWSAIEISYLFDRKLEYATGDGDYRPGETAMIRLVTMF